MKFEIWSVGIDEGVYTPMFKELESDDFSYIYATFLKLSKNGMYMITTKTLLPANELKNQKWIYESPDGGKTIYKRKRLTNDREQHEG
jgi:hypothetical protein